MIKGLGKGIRPAVPWGMPFIHVQTVPTSGSVDREAVLLDVVRALSEVIGTPPEKIHAGWSHFAVQSHGLEAGSAFRPDARPPIVTVDMFQNRTKEQKAASLRAIAAVLKEKLDLTTDPFVIVRDIPDGQVISRGEVITTGK
ncbi:MAG: tautomerase family protein [Myxococcales bacterium]|nr:tautomerase family protein [Myxococcales bacterium]